MKILIHDYAGHPFTFDLSRKLAVYNNVIYAFTYASGGPKSGFVFDDDLSLEVHNIEFLEINKNNFIVRFFQERFYGKKLVKVVGRENPDVIISANTPLQAQKELVKCASALQIPFVFWLQDIISIASQAILRNKLGFAGSLVGKYFEIIEKQLLRKSVFTVTITEDFLPILNDWGVPEENATAIPNWAPIEEIPKKPRDNDFARENGLMDKFVILYSGTLGMKHNPDIIINAARQLEKYQDIEFVVISEGSGMDYLREHQRTQPLSNLKLLPFQPFDIFPEVLGSADVLLTILEPEAGVFSVPSKVLSGLCAARPAVLVVPGENLAAKIVKSENAGFVISDFSVDSFVEKTLYLKNNEEIAQKMGRNARNYAENNFQIKHIADKFEAIFRDLVTD